MAADAENILLIRAQRKAPTLSFLSLVKALSVLSNGVSQSAHLSRARVPLLCVDWANRTTTSKPLHQSSLTVPVPETTQSNENKRTS